MAASLKLIHKKLENILKEFVWNTTPVNGNPSLQNLNGLDKIRAVLINLENLNLFNNNINTLKNTVIFTTSSSSATIQNTEVQNIISQLNTIKILMQAFIETLNKTLPAENEGSINIKLPEVNDFDELSKVSREIHVGLTQVIFNSEINGQTKIVSVENGSIWFNVLVGVTTVPVIASLVWAGAVIYKKIQEGKLLEQQVRGLKIKNDSLEDVLNAQKAETAFMIEAEAEYIQAQYFKENAPENIARIKNSIETFADLINKGAEIHPALVAPEN